MKKTALLLLSLLALGMMFNACSTDVDLYADYKDITVVYGLLDANKDTNYVKINKAFLGPGNALQIAQIADSCNYPFKLDAKLIEYKASSGSTIYKKTNRVLQLDTISVLRTEEGIFYGPSQMVYYTPERIYNNSEHGKYRYDLEIDRGDTVLTATTDMVGGYGFSIVTSSLGFTGDLGKIKWYPCPNGVIYEVVMKFRFTEVGPLNDSVERIMTWSLGTYPEYTLETDKDQFIVNYKISAFFNKLASFLGNDTLNQNVDRVIGTNPMCVSIAAGGEELYNFISVNGPSSSIVQTIPEYTNIKGGFGVFSSRTLKEKWVNSNVLLALKDYPNWRFRQG